MSKSCSQRRNRNRSHLSSQQVRIYSPGDWLVVAPPWIVLMVAVIAFVAALARKLP
jgi:hypothetical protein